MTSICHSTAGGARVALLDRGWGKPAQPHTGEDAEVRVTIRTFTEGGDRFAIVLPHNGEVRRRGHGCVLLLPGVK